jgi:hypothetical protein
MFDMKKRRSWTKGGRRSVFMAGLGVVAAGGMLGALAPAAGAVEAPAASGSTLYSVLQPLNGSGARAVTLVGVRGNELTVSVEADGLTPNAPHAQHLHGRLDGEPNVCPGPSADTNGDGLISTVEGQPAYGSIDISLTTQGDVSPASGLAVDRFPVADANGHLSYHRTFEVSADVAAAVGRLVVVQHGIDLNGSGTYDGAAPSSLDPSLPLEATIPADCGTLMSPGQDGTMPMPMPMPGQGNPSGMEVFTADLGSLNGSGASGTATLTLDRAQRILYVHVQASGLAPDQEHIQHIHGFRTSDATCPTMAADTDGDGLISTAEGASAYGPILVFLNDNSGSGPVADSNGNVDFENSYRLSEETANELTSFAVVEHGIDLNGSGAYDGAARSTVNPNLPLEATIPATCGVITASAA